MTVYDGVQFFSHLACVYFTIVSVNNYKCGNSIMAGHIKNSICADALGGGLTWVQVGFGVGQQA